MTSIASLAAEHDAQTHQLAALLGLDTYEAYAVLDEATEADYRNIIATGSPAEKDSL